MCNDNFPLGWLGEEGNAGDVDFQGFGLENQLLGAI